MLLTEGAAALHMLRHKNSIYHAIYGDMDLWLLPRVSRTTGNLSVATFHEPHSTLDWLAIDDIIRRLDAVILVSESQRVYFEALLPTERIFVVPHGIDTDFFSPAETLSNEPICVTVGSHLRDYETLKRAMELIWQMNSNVHLVAVGTRKDPNLQFQCDEKRIRFLDGVSDEDLRLAYQMARLALFSFRDATANNAMLEAMACGLPVIATDVGGIREYLGEEAGILCPPRDPEAFANGVLRLLDDASLAAQTSKASRARALGYDYRRVAGQMSQVYSEILTAT